MAYSINKRRGGEILDGRTVQMEEIFCSDDHFDGMYILFAQSYS
jgi:hypothetical protein